MGKHWLSRWSIYPTLRDIFRKVRRWKQGYTPLITVRISKSAILHNLHTFQSLQPDTLVAPVLKSNAYGHGLVEIARIIDGEGIPFIVLDSLHEAQLLRSQGIHSPILIIGYTPAETMLRAKAKETMYTITSLDHLQAIVHTKKSYRVHIKIDTGMHRQGIPESEWVQALQILKSNSLIKVDGICSHFADADGDNPEFTRTQIRNWHRARALFANEIPGITYFHIAATAGTQYLSEVSANVVRLGLGLYGIDAAPASTLGLKPALSVETVIAGVKGVCAGNSIGYNATYTAQSQQRIATIPMGYFEGIDRRLSNAGVVLVHGIPCPILGRVSMNITTIDVTSVPRVKLGDTAVVISADIAAPNTVSAIAHTTGTIPWEILVHIPHHLRRMVIT